MKKKTTTAILILLSLLFAAIAPAAMAEEEYISISTADMLIDLAYSEDDDKFEKNYCLECDIDMSTATDTRPVKAIGSYSGGSDDEAFDGIFDGKGHKIKNLITDSEALFGYIGQNGKVENIVLEKASVHYQQNDSSKYPAALVSLNEGIVENCYSVNSTVVSQYCSPAGGLVGANFGTVKTSGVFGGSVSFSGNIGTSHGGFVGNMRGGKIEECYAVTTVEAKKWAGGFVGKAEDGVISDCFASGTVIGSEEVGGFAGALAFPSVIKNVYVTNDITAQSGGGLVGGKGFSFAECGIIENSLYNRDTKKPTLSGSFENGGEMSAEEMKTVDFAMSLSDKWTQNAEENNGFPYLSNTRLYKAETKTIIAKLMIANYNSETYEYEKISETEINSNKKFATVADIMDAAVDNGLLSYTWGKNESSTQIVTIEGITPKAPDGWMFAINGTLSYVGASAASVSDGDEILWFVGTPENSYTPPIWDDIDDNAYNLISSAEDLINLSKNSDNWNKNYKLSADIDLSGKEFSPIGNEEKPFSGIFDGNGFEITNLTINTDEQNIGLFGVIHGAKLRNIKIVNADISADSVVGVLVGKAKADKNGANLIASCSVSGKISAMGNSYIKQTDVGGLAGINDAFSEDGISNMSAIDKCTAAVEVVAGEIGKAEAGHVGGLVGFNKGIVSDSTAMGNVVGGNTTGGFVGTNYGGSIYNSTATGNVTGAYTTGGFGGSLGLFGTVENCSSRGDVTIADKNGSYFGGFAGSISGTVKNCVSCGIINGSANYNGGFAGSFDGNIWSYNDDLRSIKNCFGNVYTADGRKIKALGNYIGGVHMPTDMAAEEIGVDKETAENKIKEISAKNKLEEEADKYKDGTAVPAIVAEGADITDLIAKLNINNSADKEIIVSYKSDSDAITADDSGYVLSRKGDGVENVMLTFSADGAEFDKNIRVQLLSKNENTNSAELLENIAKSFSGNCDNYWKAILLSAYDKIAGTDYSDSEYAQKAAETIYESATDTSVAMSIIALRALGYNPSEIVMSSGEKVDAYSILKETASSGNNGDAYKLLAYAQGEYADSEEIEKVTQRLLDSMIDEKGWSNNNDGGVDPDTTGAVILGLSKYCENAAVNEAVNSAVEYLSGLVQADGNIKSSYKESNYGTNANTSAICAIGLEAVGIKIAEDARFTKKSVTLLDGIMSFASKDGFVYDYAEQKINTLATEQAALAVLAAENNVNIFDFSKNSAKKLNLSTNSTSSNGSGGSIGNGANVSDKKENKEESKIYFTLVGDTAHDELQHETYQTWIAAEEFEISENMTAAEAVQKIFAEKKYLVKGIENGYITEITTPDGVVLGEYTNGQNSGWLYSVNDEAPMSSINEYILKNGDRLKLYYVDDWSKQSFKDVNFDDWFAEAAEKAAEKGYISGNEEGEFMPNSLLTRAMAVTILGRYDNADVSEYTSGNFDDVALGEWYCGYVLWAADKKIVSGISENIFAPSENITREQIAAILYRYAKSKGINSDTTDFEEFSDWTETAEWAKEAIVWAKNNGIISGMGDGRFAPKENTTRAQFAVIIMNFDKLIAKTK